jgi:hypothetical protein
MSPAMLMVCDQNIKRLANSKKYKKAGQVVKKGICELTQRTSAKSLLDHQMELSKHGVMGWKDNSHGCMGMNANQHE